MAVNCHALTVSNEADNCLHMHSLSIEIYSGIVRFPRDSKAFLYLYHT